MGNAETNCQNLAKSPLKGDTYMESIVLINHSNTIDSGNENGKENGKENSKKYTIMTSGKNVITVNRLKLREFEAGMNKLI